MIFDDDMTDPFPVVTPRLIVRPYRSGDLAAIAQRRMEIEGGDMTPGDAEFKAEQMLASYQGMNARQHVVLGAFSIEDGETLRAHFNAHVTGRGPGEWEIGYHVPEGQRRQRYAGECVQAMAGVFAAHLNGRALVAQTPVTNFKSRQVLTRAGFQPAEPPPLMSGRLYFRLRLAA